MGNAVWLLFLICSSLITCEAEQIFTHSDVLCCFSYELPVHGFSPHFSIRCSLLIDCGNVPCISRFLITYNANIFFLPCCLYFALAHGIVSNKPIYIINQPWGFMPCNPSTWEVDARGSGVQDQPKLHSECEASMDYMRPWSQTKQNILSIFNDILLSF